MWLRGGLPRYPDILLARDGPVWDRHFSDETDAEDCALLDQTLAHLGAARMVMGHTVQEQGINAACDGRAWRIGVGLAAHYGGPTEVLEIAGDSVRVLSGQ
jgi:hypothetical protein